MSGDVNSGTPRCGLTMIYDYIRKRRRERLARERAAALAQRRREKTKAALREVARSRISNEG